MDFITKVKVKQFLAKLLHKEQVTGKNIYNNMPQVLANNNM